jgi:hypothetical protein
VQGYDDGTTTVQNTYTKTYAVDPGPSGSTGHASLGLGRPSRIYDNDSEMNLFLNLGVCGHDAWAQEAAAGLTDGGFYCNTPPAPGGDPDSPNAGRANYHTTWTDTRGLAWQEVLDEPASAPLPAIRIGINPNPGVVNIESWFWIERATYANQPVQAAAPPVPVDWEESWDETTTQTEDVPCPNGDPGPCTTEVSETHTVHVPHTDYIDVSETYTPLGYVWDFGDGQPDSERSYAAPDGLGTPYTDPTSRSTVHWTYAFDSRAHPNGYPITVTAVWQVNFHVRATSDMPAGNYDFSGTLGSRDRTYSTTHVVRQVQAVRVALTQGSR